jgi:hypothetical protein
MGLCGGEGREEEERERDSVCGGVGGWGAAFLEPELYGTEKETDVRGRWAADVCLTAQSVSDVYWRRWRLHGGTALSLQKTQTHQDRSPQSRSNKNEGTDGEEGGGERELKSLGRRRWRG